MAANSDGCILTTVVTCKGDLESPEFPAQLKTVVNSLNSILGEVVKICKLEPWNSVRVTLSIPREAALRLRQLASEGSQLLKALGILSVQVEGDQVISLRVAAGALSAEPQEIILHSSDGPSTSGNVPGGRQEYDGPLGRLFSANTVSTSCGAAVSEKVQFKSPNVVCPSDSVVPKAAVTNAATSSSSSKNPFPFTSMNQAIHSREINHHQQQHSQPPPPPYPHPPPPQPPVSISSPLLVNLLQNDGPESVPSVSSTSFSSVSSGSKLKCPRTVTVTNNNIVPPLVPPLVPQQTSSSLGSNSSVPPLAVNSHSNNNTSNDTNLSQSALTKHQTISTSTFETLPLTPPIVVNSNNCSTSNISRNLPPPPPYPQTWTSPTHLPDIMSSLTDLKADDLDHLLPSLEHELAQSPPDLPEELTNSNHSFLNCVPEVENNAGKNFLINPLTGEMELHFGESEQEGEGVIDVFTDLPSPPTLFSDEDTTSSTSRTDIGFNVLTDQSDSDTRSSMDTTIKHRYKNSKTKETKGRDSPALIKPEKIKLRLKLEKSEPVNPAYKVDVSFINTQQPKKASVAPAATTTGSEELRVPPLHISLRGRNHVVITSKKRTKLLSDGEKVEKKVRKSQDLKKKDELNSIGEGDINTVPEIGETISDQAKIRSPNPESRKIKKPKLNHEHKESLKESLMSPGGHLQDAKMILQNFHFKEKQKERRGSDSDLARANKKFLDSNGIISEEKKRRLSQSDQAIDGHNLPGSTNVGTISGLSKPRKEKVKNKELNRNKSYSKNLAEKLAKHQVALPTGEIDMGAKFKQRLMEGVNRPPHRTEQLPALEKPPPVEEKPPVEPDKCNTPERKPTSAPLPTEIGEKQSAANRSPNGGAQGEDSGIESMDALSEKSPNQASQSPHADLPESALKPKTQVPDMLDIEAQLAKMEGIKSADDCCDITSALQDSLKQGAVTLSVHTAPNMTQKEKNYNSEVTLTPITGASKEDDLEPLPIRVAPPLYTYSNPEKTREQNQENPYEQDTTETLHKSKSLLEQLLIEIPTDQQHSGSPSPAMRSVRTRASSKLNSPEINLNSPVTRQHNREQRASTPANMKRKRNESDSSTHSTEENRKKTRRNEVGEPKLAEVRVNNNKRGVNVHSKGNEDSDSDEPLSEKMRKGNTHNHGEIVTATTGSANNNKSKVNKSSTTSAAATTVAAVVATKNAPISTRRSVRSAMPAQNTRSKGDMKTPTLTDAEAVRRKTRSAVLDSDHKRKKEIK